ncbi:hypothetical protein U1Q18_019960, partial [Sarracenia purpurea var. burkii]
APSLKARRDPLKSVQLHILMIPTYKLGRHYQRSALPTPLSNLDTLRCSNSC